MHEYLFSIFPNEKFIDLGLYQYGWERCAPAHQFGPAARTHYLFHYVISGTGLLMAQDKKGETRNYSIKSGQGFLLYPGQIRQPSRIFIGITSFSPAFAETAPFRRIMESRSI